MTGNNSVTPIMKTPQTSTTVTENGSSVAYTYAVNYLAILTWIKANPAIFPSSMLSGRIQYYSALPDTTDTTLNNRWWTTYPLSDPFGKADPGGCAGPGPANGNPTTYPPTCSWNLYAGQSLNLTSDPAHVTWTTGPVTTTPMHIGDICNLGIACLAPSSNRNLLDFITETLDPQGCAHIAYSDDNTVKLLRAANQTSGPCIIRHHR